MCFFACNAVNKWNEIYKNIFAHNGGRELTVKVVKEIYISSASEEQLNTQIIKLVY